MNSPLRSFLLTCLPIAGAMAQVPGALLTFSQNEYTISGGGGPLQVLRPNEIAFLPLVPGCPNGARSEKWSPRTCMNVMAGDENSDGQYWNPSLFGSIDALQTAWGLSSQTSSLGTIAPNPRLVYWSPSAQMGNHINSPTNQNPPLRPGDMGLIKQDGTVEFLMKEEVFRKALGLVPTDPPIDIDAFAYEPGLGIYFSLDASYTLCQLSCATNQWILDGTLLAIPWSQVITYGVFDFRIQDVLTSGCAHEIFDEVLVKVHLQNSGITDRFGVANLGAGDLDLESLEIDHGPGTSIMSFPTCGPTVLVPNFLFSTDSMTGGSLASTINYGSPPMGPCGYLGIPVPYGIQNGTAVGIQQQLATVGPASYVNALAFGTTERFVLEPVAHQQNYGLLGGPPTTVHVGGDFNYVFTWVDLAPNTIAPSVNIGGDFFPDWYCLNLLLWDIGFPVNGFHSFATPNIPVGWSGKLIFQSIGFDAACTNCSLNLSTPCVIDVN